jgi:hypothetical protein
MIGKGSSDIANLDLQIYLTHTLRLRLQTFNVSGYLNFARDASHAIFLLLANHPCAVASAMRYPGTLCTAAA